MNLGKKLTYACALLLLLAICSSAEEATIKINLATSKNMWCGLTHIALAKGYFEKENLDVKAEYVEAGRYAMDAVLSGFAQVGNVVEVNVAYLGFTGNKDVKIVATIVSSDEMAILARKSSGINKPEDLKHKKIAIAPGTTSEIFVERLLTKHGLSLSDVELVKMQPKAVPIAMVAGAVDAASMWEPFVYNIEKVLAADVIRFKDPSVYVGYDNILVSSNWAADNPSGMERLLKAYNRALNFLRDNQSEAQEIIANATALELDVVKASWASNNYRIDLDVSALDSAITEVGRWIRASQGGYQNKPLPDYKSYLDPSYLPQK